MDKEALNEEAAAAYLSMMCANKGSWNLEVVVLTFQDLAPTLSWKEVIRKLDNPQFSIKYEEVFRMLIAALKKVMKEPFPIDYLYKVWDNTEAQVNNTLF